MSGIFYEKQGVYLRNEMKLVKQFLEHCIKYYKALNLLIISILRRV